MKRNVFAPREFADIHDANRRLAVWTTEVAGQRVHGTTHERPLERFALEQAHLRPLPPTPFACVQWKQVTVAQAACRRAQYYGNYTYPGIRDILRQGLDREPLPAVVVPAATPTERPRYARRLDELLQLPLLKEDSDDAH